jgi:acetyl esterase/lipase
MAPQNETGVVYGSGLTNGGSKTLRMDIYQTGQDCTALRPLVMIIHGGGFTRGSKTQSPWPDRARDAVARDYVAVSIDYRLIGDNPVVTAEFDPLRTDLINANQLPAWTNSNITVFATGVAAAVEDTVTALRYLQNNNPSDRCIDMTKIALWGGSAGAMTAMHTAYGLDEYSITFPQPGVVIDYWGSVFIDGMMSGNDAPFFIVHGEQDSVVDHQEALDLASEADSVGLKYAFYTVAGADHGYSTIDIKAPVVNGATLLGLTMNFIDAHLKGGTPVYETRTVN